MSITNMFRLASMLWVSKVTRTVFSFGTVLILSRYLGAADRGICAFYGVIFVITSELNHLAGGNATMYLMQKIDWRQLRRIYIGWSFIGSTVVCAIFLLMGKITATQAAWFWVIGLVNSTAGIQHNIMLGLKQYRAYNIFSVLFSFFGFAFTIVFFMMGWRDPDAYVAAVTIVGVMFASIGAVLLQNAATPEGVSQLGWKDLSIQAFRNGGLTQIVSVFEDVSSRIAFLLFPAVLLGSYANSLSLSAAMLMVPDSLGKIYYSRFAGERSQEAAGRGFISLLKVNAAILLAGWLAILIIPAQFYVWIFGAEFAEVKGHLVYLGAGSVFLGMYQLISYWHSASGNFTYNLFFMLTSLLSNIVMVGYLHLSGDLTVQTIAIALMVSYIFAGVFSLGHFWYQQRLPITSR